jgi:polysaccharide biosynthesis transport protein
MPESGGYPMSVSTGPEQRLDLRHQLQILRRRIRTVLLPVLVLLVIAAAYIGLKTRTYQATAELQLTPQISSSLLATNNAVLSSAVDVQTDIQLLQSQKVARLVRKTLADAPPVQVVQVGTSDVVDVSTVSSDPRLAAAAANAYVAAYIQAQLAQSVGALTSVKASLQARLDSNQTSIDALETQIGALSSLSDPRFASLNSQLQSLEASDESLRLELSQYSAAEALATGGQLITAAVQPRHAAAPKPVEDVALALFLGLGIGVAAAFTRDRLDDTIWTFEDLSRAVPDLPTLGSIPRVPEWRDVRTPYAVTVRDPGSPASEAYRTLRTSLGFLAMESHVRKVLVTSASGGEGKSSTVVNLAVSLSLSRRRVTVVDCDLRRPRVHEFFGLRPSPDFLTALADGSVEDCLHTIPDVPGLQLLLSSVTPPNPAELLSLPATAALLNKLAIDTDLLLVDSPPVLPVADSLILAENVDLVLLVVRSGVTKRRELSRALTALKRVNAPVRGVIFNGAERLDSYQYESYSTRLTDNPSDSESPALPTEHPIVD